MLKKYKKQVVTYGFEKNNTYQIKNIVKTTKHISWDVVYENKIIPLSLSISGEHNILNATASYIVGMFCFANQEDIQKALLAFSGTKRRMEYVGQLPTGALLYDDYAHHPTEIEKTLTALKEKYPNKHIVCIFQPHTYSRTKLLFEQFVDSLSLADEVVMTDIYSSQREAFDTSVSSSMLAEKIALKKSSFLAKTLPDVVNYIKEKAYSDNTIVITMGAGDVYQVANDLLE